VGAGRDFNLPGVPLENRDWEESLESEQLQSFDAGIMPLENTPWERGKCGYKLIQYMAVGRPVVASPVGVNAHIVEDGVNGFLVADGDAWVRALSHLRDQPALCAQLGQAGRDRVRREYTLQVTAPRLAAWLQEVADMT
jgi:glycosyltransferase involved in cell wall biosynthesis